METLHIDLRNPTSMADFFDAWSGLASKEAREQAGTVVRAIDQNHKIPLSDLSEALSEFARGVWPVRYALNRFFEKEGALVEWDAVSKAVRRSTAQLMERFRETADIQTLDEMLGHDEVDTVLHDEERHEIQEVRHHIREDYYRSHASQLEPLVKEAGVLLAHFQSKMSDMRKVAEGLPTLLQEELYSKITRFEDRVLFGGDHVSSEILDDELKYYREQEALPI